MAISLVHSADGTGNFGPSGFSGSVTVTAPTSGNFVLFAVFGPTGATFATPTLTNVTWTLLTSQASQGDSQTAYIWYGIASATGGTTLGLTSSTSGLSGYGVTMQYAEFSGVATSSEVDVYAKNNQAGQTGTSFTCSTSTISTTNADDLVVAFMTCCCSGAPLSLSGGPYGTENIEAESIEFEMMGSASFTSINTETVGGPVELATQLAYLVSTVQDEYNASQNFSDGSSVTAYCQSIIVGFLPAATGSSTTDRGLMAIYPPLALITL